jgi:hypothetical protein
MDGYDAIIAAVTQWAEAAQDVRAAISTLGDDAEYAKEAN